MLKEASKKSATIPTKIDELEAAASTIVRQRENADSHLAAILSKLLDNSRHLDRGYDRFESYVEQELGYSADKARILIAGWRDWEFLGLPVSLISTVSWSKFRALAPLIKNGTITEQNIVEWLPKITLNGSGALRLTDLSTQVKRLLADTRATQPDTPDGMAVVKLQVPAAQLPEVQRNLEIIQEKFVGAGTTPAANLLAFGAATAVDGDVATKTAQGLVSLKNTAERLAPGLTVLFVPPANTEEFSYESLGVLPALYVFESVEDNPRFIIALDEEEAKEELKVKEVLRHTLVASKSFRGAPGHAAAKPEATKTKQKEIENDYPSPDDFEPEDMPKVLKAFSKILAQKDSKIKARFSEFTKTLKSVGDEQEQWRAAYAWMVSQALQHGMKYADTNGAF